MKYRFLKKIQKSDNVTKTLWLWIFTVGTSLVVVLLWVGYLNLTVAQVSYDGVANAPVDQGFFSTLSAGLLSIRSQAHQGLNILLRENLIDIKIPRHNFVYQELEKVPMTALP